MRLVWLLSLLLAARGYGQIDLQASPTMASLRGIDAPTGQIAWASGTGGTVLRTLDGGAHWQACAVPPGAEKLDFRGVQAVDGSTAVVMASGKGALSRVYRTIDGCATWKLVFTNPDADGFFDTIRRVTARQMYLLGDPVGGKFAMFLSQDAGETWFIADDPGLDAVAGDGAFAASNSSLTASRATLFFATGGTNVPQVYATRAACPPGQTGVEQACPLAWGKAELPLAGHAASAGAFSLAGRTQTAANGRSTTTLVAVGGVYDKPLDAAGTAAVSRDAGRSWRAASAMPGGYRSAVAFDRETQMWLAAGPSGVDVSPDDGATWRPLRTDDPAVTANWNAIALPYLVGPKGRIGKLRAGALKP